ncbi:MAG: hypothetical protein ACK5MK_12110 [Dysgonomonas sp.]
MDTFFLVLLIVLLFLLALAIPVALSYLIYRFVKKREWNKWFRWLCIIPLCIPVWIACNELFPSEGYYKEEFRDTVLTDFPRDGEFLYKNSSLPDFKGDYTSVMIVKTDSSYYNFLQKHLTDSKFGESGQAGLLSANPERILKRGADQSIVKTFKLDDEIANTSYAVSFLSDKQTFVVEKVKW